MSKEERTIIFSIHQPRYSIFKLSDSLTLWASGRLMVHGPAQEALKYFASAGHHCEHCNNPADFFLDVINGDSSAVVLNRENRDGEVLETGKSKIRVEQSVFVRFLVHWRTTIFSSPLHKLIITVILGLVSGAIF
ncbi:broad substrate specificity ATP-binding cassette transporter ABCG2-like [Molossus nigricans]